MSKLVEHFLNAPHDQIDHKIIEYAKTSWRKPLPTLDQCKQTLKLMEKYHASTFVRKMMYTIQLESEEAEQIVFDDKAKRPEFKC